VLRFTQTAFELALGFIAEEEGVSKAKRPRRKPPGRKR
jgi:hypothetical protein